MANQTADEIAAHYVAMGHSVAEVNSSKGADETAEEFTARKARNKEHLVLQKHRSTMMIQRGGQVKVLQLSMQL